MQRILGLFLFSLIMSAEAQAEITLKGELEKRSCPEDKPVKGNINSFKKTKIYHLPGNSHYERTNPEACFKNSAEAEAAGFRASRSN